MFALKDKKNVSGYSKWVLEICIDIVDIDKRLLLVSP